jgi:hypothetical protein
MIDKSIREYYTIAFKANIAHYIRERKVSRVWALESFQDRMKVVNEVIYDHELNKAMAQLKPVTVLPVSVCWEKLWDH